MNFRELKKITILFFSLTAFFPLAFANPFYQDLVLNDVDSPYFNLNQGNSAFVNTDSNLNNAVFSLWDQSMINPYKMDISKKTDTTLLLLVNDSSLYIHPVRGIVFSGFGMRGSRYHYGMDIDLETGDSVLCAFNGRVRLAGYYGGYGNYVVVTHSNGLETLYGHLSKILVETDQELKAGDLLGYGGRTGRATGSHLHFEVRFMGVPMNPEKLIDFKTYSLHADTLAVCCDTYDYLVERSKVKYYFIKSGDTLSKISRMYGVSISKLCALNNISPTTILQIGRAIRYQ